MKARDLIGDCLKAAGLVEKSLATPNLPREELETQTINVQEGRVLIWELCELNFRWELQALDRQLYDKKHFGRLERQAMLLRCFSTKFEGITSVHPELARTGLASPTFMERLPYLQALWQLMDNWRVPKPASWNSCPQNPTTALHGEQWERDMIQFYAQTFFDHFARPAVLPMTLNTDDLHVKWLVHVV